MESNRQLLVELHNTLEVFRTIFADDKSIYNSIDESYEEILMHELAVVPEQFDIMIIQYISIVKVLATNINFRTLANTLDEMNKNHELPTIKIDTMDMITMGFKALNLSKGNLARILNITLKLRPIFKCMDRLFNMPIGVLKKIGDMQCNSEKYTDLI